MSSTLVDTFDLPWTSSNAAVLQPSVLTEQNLVRSRTHNRVIALPGALNEVVTFTPAAPLDLTAFDEFRLWVRASRRADGSPARPFFLEFSYTDTNDLPTEEHRWFVPVNRRLCWEQRRVGIENDRRSSIDSFRFRALVDQSFLVDLDNLIAVRDQMLPDLESALQGALSENLQSVLGDPVPFAAPASIGDLAVAVTTTAIFSAGNQVLLQGGSAGDEVHRITVVAQIPGATQLTLALPLAGNYVLPGPTATIQVPIIVEAPPAPTDVPTPALLVNHLDLREDLERSGFYWQRDSFRPRDTSIEVSVRPSARAYRAEYQILAQSPIRLQQAQLHEHVTRRLSATQGLILHDRPAPVTMLPAPPQRDDRVMGQIAPVYVQIGVSMETHPRQPLLWVAHPQLDAGQLGALNDVESIAITI